LTFLSAITATICVPFICLLPIILFSRISQPGIKGLEVYFPFNAFLLVADLLQDYWNAGELLIFASSCAKLLPDFFALQTNRVTRILMGRTLISIFAKHWPVHRLATWFWPGLLQEKSRQNMELLSPQKR
jgi:hypothetical protein